MDVQLYIFILVCLLGMTIFMIFRCYQTDVTRKSFITCVYLYVIFATLFVALIGKITQTLGITSREHVVKMTIVYLVVVCTGIFMMVSNNMVVTHIGFLLMLLALSLIMGSIYKYSDDVFNAAVITACIVIVLTLIVYLSPEETIEKMSNWTPYLISILCVVIIGQIIYIFFFEPSKDWMKYLSIFLVGLFMFFILSDTSRLLNDPDVNTCKVHSCINYPLKSSNLFLDYFNLFINVLGARG